MNTPVLFLIFNRPETTSIVFEVIRQARPTRLFIAGDGPRTNKVGEAELVYKARNIAMSIDWPCEVKTLFREKNLGCKYAVSSAISWFFQHEEYGIILEDDCVPHIDFFEYCETLLKKYENIPNVMAITGNNFQKGIRRGDESYYFSRFTHVWGWATWRRAWYFYDVEVKFWDSWKNSSSWKEYWIRAIDRRYWEKIFNDVFNGKINTWDYQWVLCIWRQNGLTATPNVNLVSNIGFGLDATHTTSRKSPDANIPTKSIGKITHPKNILQDVNADLFTADFHYNLRYFKFPLVIVVMTIRFFRNLKRDFVRIIQ